MPRKAFARQAPQPTAEVESDDGAVYERSRQFCKTVEQLTRQRNKKRKSIEADFNAKVADARSKIRKSFDRQRDHFIDIQKVHISRLLQAEDSRDQILTAICKKLQEIQNEFLNLTKQLNAAYEGRHDLAKNALDDMRDGRIEGGRKTD